MIVSLAMIVKNEEGVLGRCLQSVRGTVDEIVIVDTGSEDATKEVAAEYTDRICDFPWRKDFAAARQYAFDQARGDWVFWLDADDVVINAEGIERSVLRVSPEVQGFYWKYVIDRDEFGNSTCECWRERCVRNGRFRWVGRVHEVLVGPDSPSLVRDDGVVVVHCRDARKPRSPHRNVEILREEYRTGSAGLDQRILLLLGLEHVDLGDLSSALEFLNRYAQVATWPEQTYLAQLRMADLYRRLGRFEEALGAAFRALELNPHWAAAYYSLGETYYFLREWPKVVHWIELGQRFPPPDTICVVYPMDCRYRWMIHYTNALYHVGRLGEALQWTERALELRPNDPWHVQNRVFFAGAFRGRANSQQHAWSAKGPREYRPRHANETT